MTGECFEKHRRPLALLIAAFLLLPAIAFYGEP
jgi:hypothetical protein